METEIEENSTRFQSMTNETFTLENLNEMVKTFQPIQSVNEAFKEFVRKKFKIQGNEFPDDPVYLVSEKLFKRLLPDEDIYCDNNIPDDRIMVTSRTYINSTDPTLSGFKYS
jgi:hypothetical protein